MIFKTETLFWTATRGAQLAFCLQDPGFGYAVSDFVWTQSRSPRSAT